MKATSGRRAVSGKSMTQPSSEGVWVARFLADLLDQRFVIPGTSIRFGLDPIIGLIPGLGDIITNLAGSAILVIAARLGLPKIVLLRMGLNIAANAAIGAIPVLGDIFSIWFRSNAKNAQLLERYATAGDRRSTAKEWLLVVMLLLGALLALVGIVIAAGYVAMWIWERV